MTRPQFLSYVDKLIDSQGSGTFELWLTADQISEYQKFQAHCSRTRIYTETVHPLRYRGHAIRSTSKRQRRARFS